MATKSQLQKASESKDNVIIQQSEEIDELKHQLELTEQDKNQSFIQVSKHIGIPYMLVELLNPAGKVYFTLAALANYQNMVQISNTTLSEVLDMHPTNVRKHIKTLRDIGALEIVKNGTSNIYILNPDITWGAKNSQRRYCKFEGTTILPASLQAQLDDAHVRLEDKRKTLTKPNTVQ